MAVNYPNIDMEINEVISLATPRRMKKSKEKHRRGMMLYSPIDLNKEFLELFGERGYEERKITYNIETTDGGKVSGYKQIDFVKNRVNIEVQFGKYAFMFYDMSKFQNFFNENQMDVGVEIVPSHRMMKEMSTGVSYGEQLVTDIKRLNRTFPSTPVKVIMIEP